MNAHVALAAYIPFCHNDSLLPFILLLKASRANTIASPMYTQDASYTLMTSPVSPTHSSCLISTENEKLCSQYRKFAYRLFMMIYYMSSFIYQVTLTSTR
jgi:hypothetical protein